MNPPIEIKLQMSARLLVISYEDPLVVPAKARIQGYGLQFELPFEYLRVFSPSAEVRGHDRTNPKLISGKKNILINAIEPVGNYAIKLIFNDGHQSGLYTWEFLDDLGRNYHSNWLNYLARLQAAKLTRI